MYFKLRKKGVTKEAGKEDSLPRAGSSESHRDTGRVGIKQNRLKPVRPMVGNTGERLGHTYLKGRGTSG